MASIRRVDNGWQVRSRTPDGGSRKKTFTRKADAEAHLVAIEHARRSGAYVDASAGRVTVAEYSMAWQAQQVWRPSTAVRVEGILANHVVPAFGARPLSSVRPSEVQAWVKALNATMAPGTVRGVHNVLSSLFRSAVRDRLVAHSPCVGTRLPARVPRLVAPLTAEQVDAVAETVGERYRPLVILGAGAGLRVGEALGLTVGSVDFLRRQLSVTQQAVTVRRVTTLAPPKSAASVRTVPLSGAVLADLAAHLERHPTPPGSLLVADADGAPIPQNRFSTTWTRAAKRADLPPGTRFHDLRHTFASALIAHGCSVKAVQAALGHESAAVTLDTYSHLWPSDEDRTRAAIEDFLRSRVSLACPRGSTPGQKSWSEA